jgi:hypothetical protein
MNSVPVDELWKVPNQPDYESHNTQPTIYFYILYVNFAPLINSFLLKLTYSGPITGYKNPKLYHKNVT